MSAVWSRSASWTISSLYLLSEMEGALARRDLSYAEGGRRADVNVPLCKMTEAGRIGAARWHGHRIVCIRKSLT
jgi:hypothetical protein